MTITAEQLYDEYVSGDRDKVAAVLADQPPLVCAKVCLDIYRFLMMEHRQGMRTVAVPAGFVDWLGRIAARAA